MAGYLKGTLPIAKAFTLNAAHGRIYKKIAHTAQLRADGPNEGIHINLYTVVKNMRPWIAD
jgi:hypothetical protein